MLDRTQPTDHIRDRAIRLFTYLRELTQLRSKVIRTLKDYENVLWLSDIPREQGCFTQVWGVSQEGQEDIWVEIKKPKLPSFPSAPKELQPWVREAHLADSSKEEPELLSRILAPDQQEDAEPRFIALNDNLHLIELWGNYLEQKWKPWANEHRRLKTIQNVYTILFTIYQNQKSLGEEFELAIGFGLLSWLTPNGQRVYRHLVTGQAAISFDSDRGILTVSAPADGPKPQLEQDMLEASERPIPDILNKLEQEVKAIGDDIWNIPSMEAVLRSWVQSLSSDGVYSEEIVASTDFKTIPIVSYSPALILRKRTERGFIRLYQEIIEQLKSGEDIPAGVIRTVEIIDDTRLGNDEPCEGSSKAVDYNEVFFPLPANDEQRRIIETINARQGVMVQGPPGTGKSHTIVNLVCHLLATGKRVLVTSQTPRALKVLKEKILKEESTKEIAPLCVNLLGNDISALKDLEDSVHGITDRHHNWDPGNNARRIKELSEELDELRQRLAESNRRLREIRESETYEHILCDGAYRGTASQIAQQVSRLRDVHGWLQIRISLDEDPPLADQEALELLSLFRKLTPDLVNEIKKPVVRLEELPTPEEFVRLCDVERQAKDKHRPFVDLLQTETGRKLKAASTAQRARLRDALDKLSTTRASILNRSQPFIVKAVDDVLSCRDRNWQELHKRSSELLQGLLEKAHAAEDRKLKLPQEHAREVVLADAKSLLDHLQKGGGFGIPGFRPKPVKSARYLIKETRVDGRPCDNVDSLKALVATLEVCECLDKLWVYWKPAVDRVTGSRPAQVCELEYLNEALEAVLHLRGLVEDAEVACNAIDGLAPPAWHIIDEIELYRRILEGILCEHNLEEVRAIFAKADRAFRTALTYPETHPVVSEGHQALSERDERAFGVFYAKISSLGEGTRLLLRWRELATRLHRSAPSIADRLASEYNEKFWDDALSRFTDSWVWARVDTWVKEYIFGVSETQLSQEVKDIQNRINVTLGRLSATLAWGHCFDRLTEKERQHLIAWKQAMRRIGKGTGKHAEKHRREAREHLEGCRGAIPAWIMPLYRVAESLKPAPNIYDVVIIDEASQAGPEALFLQYIAKKIVVVGDDMQISPDSIGVPREDVDRLRDRYLKDLPLSHVGALGVEETSFFHLAEVLFGGRIILREHFRCMPEIIQFSNDLCYRSTPLIPLRQYPPNRLSPIVIAHHVSGGYREGSSQAPRNSPEAQAIVDEIVKCCRESAYKNKTIGVISLLGEYQAHSIRQKLIEAIGPEEMERRNLICGDAYAFQGDERDIIFLSLVAAPDETGMRALADQKSMRRFNVAASRARDQMWLFHTPTINDFRNKECLRYKLLNYCSEPKRQPFVDGINLEQLKSDSRSVRRTNDNQPVPFGSWFEVDVFSRIIDKGYRVIPQFEVAGYFIDLVVEGMRGRLAIECDGDEWHGPDRYDADMMRQRTLERCGWTFWRIRGSEYYHAPDQAIASLWELLDRLHIAPGGQDIEQEQDQANESPRTESETYKAEEMQEEEQHSDNDAQHEKAADITRSEMLMAILAILPPQGKMSRDEAIRAAAKFLRDRGRLEFQRIREDGDVWIQFKSAINSGVRRSLLEGDVKTIWRRAQQTKLDIVEEDEENETKKEVIVPKANDRSSSRSTEFKIGERVTHPFFGAGTVLGVEGSRESAKVIVKFDNHGIKKLVVEIARFKKNE